MVSLAKRVLTRELVSGGATINDLLGHIAAWDDLYRDRIELVVGGRAVDIQSVDLDSYNEALHRQRSAWTLDKAMAAFRQARQSFVDTLSEVPDSVLDRRVRLPFGRQATPIAWANWRWRHDATHAREILAWRKRTKVRRQVGPLVVLQAALETGREEMLATAALVAAGERESRPVCGTWSLKDVIGHVADWEWYGVERFRPGLPSGRSLNIEFPGTVQDWNEQHATARQHQSWDQVWSDFQGARQALRELLRVMEDNDLGKPLPAPWNPNGLAYGWIALWLHHEREHAADLRLNLALKRWPRRLLAI